MVERRSVRPPISPAATDSDTKVIIKEAYQKTTSFAWQVILRLRMKIADSPGLETYVISVFQWTTPASCESGFWRLMIRDTRIRVPITPRTLRLFSRRFAFGKCALGSLEAFVPRTPETRVHGVVAKQSLDGERRQFKPVLTTLCRIV